MIHLPCASIVFVPLGMSIDEAGPDAVTLPSVISTTAFAVSPPEGSTRVAPLMAIVPFAMTLLFAATLVLASLPPEEFAALSVSSAEQADENKRQVTNDPTPIEVRTVRTGLFTATPSGRWLRSLFSCPGCRKNCSFVVLPGGDFAQQGVSGT